MRGVDGKPAAFEPRFKEGAASVEHNADHHSGVKRSEVFGDLDKKPPRVSDLLGSNYPKYVGETERHLQDTQEERQDCEPHQRASSQVAEGPNFVPSLLCCRPVLAQCPQTPNQLNDPYKQDDQDRKKVEAKQLLLQWRIAGEVFG